MKIIIEPIQHENQRYPTCGDWYIDRESGDLIIRVSEEMGKDSCFLVAIHELVECYLAMRKGITVQQVDDFDIAYEKAHRAGGTIEGERLDTSEPGDDPTCPVFREHLLATIIERLLCGEMDIPWDTHADAVEALP
jgi:hypothetical protein